MSLIKWGKNKTVVSPYIFFRGHANGIYLQEGTY